MRKLRITIIELIVFGGGLILLALMSPDTDAPSLCLLDFLGYPYCPGDGLGHSIAYLFRGDVNSAIEANFFGPFAVVLLTGRIIYLIKTLITAKSDLMEDTHGKIN